MRRAFLLPALLLVLVWLGLVNKVTLGNLLLGAFLGLVLPALTGPYWPNRPRLRNPLGIVPVGPEVDWSL